MRNSNRLGGPYTFPGSGLKVNRMGYGAMQLSGPKVWGPPQDREQALAVLRAAVDAGVNHIDTSDFYGPHITNQVIKQALYPYPEDLVIATKVGTRRGDDASWIPALSARELTDAVHDNLRNLGLNVLPLVNLRVGAMMSPVNGSIEAQFSVLAKLRDQGKIRELGVSNVTPQQVAEAQKIAPVVCVQNFYNVAHRDDDTLLMSLARQGIAYIPFFPLGGFSPFQSSALDSAAAFLDATPMQVALSWLLQRSPNILLIPGTSSLEHLRENLRAVNIKLSSQILEQLDSPGRVNKPKVASE